MRFWTSYIQNDFISSCLTSEHCAGRFTNYDVKMNREDINNHVKHCLWAKQELLKKTEHPGAEEALYMQFVKKEIEAYWLWKQSFLTRREKESQLQNLLFLRKIWKASKNTFALYVTSILVIGFSPFKASLLFKV